MTFTQFIMSLDIRDWTLVFMLIGAFFQVLATIREFTR